MVKIAFYGKGGIGKSTAISNVSAALAEKGYKVLQIGCDPKHDSTRLLLGGFQQATVLEQLNHSDTVKLADVMLTGYKGTKCIEAGGPEPGVGCAGRGIIQMINLLNNQGLNMSDFEYVFFDVLGDVVCGGFAVPMREGFAQSIYIVTSGELASLYAANNIAKGLRSHSSVKGKLAGIIGNERGTKKERELIAAFAQKLGTEMVAFIPRSEIVQQAELESQTVIEYAPNSELAGIYRSLAQKIEQNKTPVVPTPMEDSALEDFISEFCYCKKPVRKNFPNTYSVKKNLKTADCQTCDPVKDAKETSIDWASAKVTSLKPRALLYGCSLAGAYAVVSQIEDAVAVMDSPIACAFNTFYTTLNTPQPSEKTILPNLVCTDMREKEVIFGAEKKLKQVILDANKRVSPAVTFVITSCPSGIIGEDSAHIIEQLRKEGLDVVDLKSDGAMSGDFNAGVQNSYKIIAEHFINRNLTPSGDMINIIGEQGLSTVADKNFNELTNVLNALELTINCRFIRKTTVQSIKNFKLATVNIPATNEIVVQNLLDYFDKDFNVPYLKAPLPLAFEQTVEFTRALGKMFHRESEAETLINQARLKYDAQIAHYQPFWEAKKVMIFGFVIYIDWLIATLLDLHANVQKVCVSKFYYETENFCSRFADKVQVVNDYPFDNREKDILEHQPDLVLYNFMPKNLTNTKIIHDVFPFCPSYGFLSGMEYVRKWTTRLKVPFSEGWKYDRKLFNLNA